MFTSAIKICLLYLYFTKSLYGISNLKIWNHGEKKRKKKKKEKQSYC